uniref:Uncharacterized protein n=1 Tax=Romanomermis culicivorax TaxID=13658 RepID=A0A915I5X9_ROMCU
MEEWRLGGADILAHSLYLVFHFNPAFDQQFHDINIKSEAIHIKKAIYNNSKSEFGFFAEIDAVFVVVDETSLLECKNLQLLPAPPENFFCSVTALFGYGPVNR